MVAITRKMNRFDAAARRLSRSAKTTSAKAIQTAWRRTMGTSLTSQAALNFLRHYKSMVRPSRKAGKAGKTKTRKTKARKTRSRKQRGGADSTLSGAPIAYGMGPGQAGNVHAAGFPVSAAFGPEQFGRFTDDVTSFKPLLNQVGGPLEIPIIAQTADCGVDRFPTDPSKAQVGAGYTRRRKNRRRSPAPRQRGGSLLDFFTSPSNYTGGNSVNVGGTDKTPPDHSWGPSYTNGTFINTTGISKLDGLLATNSLQAYAPAQFVV